MNMIALLSSSINNYQWELKKDKGEQEHWSIYNPPRHYAYVPSVTLTPTTICIKPFKLVKTNRVLREEKFGGNFMFALVDIKDENGSMDIFPHDCMLNISHFEFFFFFFFYQISSKFRSSFTLENRNAT